MTAFKTNLFTFACTSIVVLLVAVNSFGKEPPEGPGQPRPKPTNGSSLGGKQLANTQILGIADEKEESSGFTITHGGNPPRGDGGGFVITHGGNPPRAPKCDDHCHDSCHRNNCDREQCECSEDGIEPLHSTCIVTAGDSFASISRREYGTTFNAPYIAKFNRLSLNRVLVPGQFLVLPSVGPNNVLLPSHAPVATPLPVVFGN
jgi:nucleoid-associated protein YgaU